MRFARLAVLVTLVVRLRPLRSGRASRGGTTYLHAATLVLGLGTVGCALPFAIPRWTTIQHDIAGIDAVSQLEPVALYQFKDSRVLGGSGSATRLAVLFERGQGSRRYVRE